jgi:NitT/TauT family transport system substrate-binding protein
MRGAGFRTMAAAVAAAGAVVLAAGCSSGTAATDQAGAAGGVSTAGGTGPIGPIEKPDVTVAVVPAVDSAGFFIALHQGFFKAAGLNVTFVPAISSETAIADQIKGTYDITAGNYVSYIQSQQSGQGSFDIFAEGSVMTIGAQALYTIPGSDIKTLADLQGKTVGINAPNNILYLLTASVLNENGINVKRVRFTSDYPFPLMATALENDKIQAAVLPEPFASEAEQGNGVTTLSDLNQGATSSFPIEGYVATKKWAKQYPNTLKAFERALAEGQTLANTNRVDLEAAMEALPKGMSVSPATAAVMALDNYPVNQVDPVRLQRVANAMTQFIGFPKFDMTSMIGS